MILNEVYIKGQFFMPEYSSGRIKVFDSLKSSMIFFVIVLHVSMTFMQDAPEWWSVAGNEQSKAMVVLVNVLDVFIIPVLFFISGYFTPASYLKKGASQFLKDKFIHIALPWLLGMVVLIPLIPLCLGQSVGNVVNLLKEDPLYIFHNQLHLWYLGVLFLFFVIYALYARFVIPVEKTSAEIDKKPATILILLVVISAVCAYLSSSYYTDFDNWISFAYIFSLKPAKIVTYICVFILGIYAWRYSWFSQGGWMPDIRLWRGLAIGLMICYLVLRLLIMPDYDYPVLRKIEPVLDSICVFFTLFYAVAIGMKFQNAGLPVFLAKMSPYSYGIYWIHMPLMILFLRLINTLDLPLLIKWFLGIILTTIASWLISKYILKKVPLLKRIF